MVVWFTGLSGAGKSTLAMEIARQLKKSQSNVVLLDGDQIREVFGNDLGFDEGSRKKQIQRIQRVASLLDSQGMFVLVSALYSNPEILNWNRSHFKEYFEVFMRADIESLRRRDAKDLYGSCLEGRRTHVVGVDIPFESPKNPDLVIETNRFEPIEKCSAHFFERLSAKFSGKLSGREQWPLPNMN
jgi:adenylyl-sulfate kinase